MATKSTPGGKAGASSSAPSSKPSSKAAAKASQKAAAQKSAASATSGGKGSGLTPQQKVAAMRKQATRRQRLRKGLIAAAAVVVVGGAGTAIGVYYATREDPLADVQTYTGLARDHVQGTVDYQQTPPVGGPHNAVWLNCGVYSQPVPNENAVHDLEHGAVWITYRPDLPQDQVEKLQDIVRSQTYLTLSPYPDLPAPVVASAWEHQLKLTGADDSRLDAFIQEYKQGPQTPEPGAACTGGTGTPVQ